jgi:hypothetical protein
VPFAELEAEQAASYVLARLRERAGVRLLQGAQPVPLTPRPLGPALDLIASTRLRGVSRPVSQALIAWGEGRRRVHLLARIPAAREVLAWQADGERCVSLLADDVPTAPHEDGLAFAMHDLCHLEKFVDPEHHAGQVGFFAAVHAATLPDTWPRFMRRFDAELAAELEHVVADMNGSAVFLFAALKMKLKMAARRRVARELGRPVRVAGPLDSDEEAAYRAELETLLDLLAVDGATREAGTRVSTRRDDQDAALAVLRYFEALGSTRLLERCRATS